MVKRRQTSGSRRAAILILAAFMLISLLTLAALAVDIGYLCCLRTEAQAVADAAAMAGAKGLATGPEQVRANVLACAALNTVNGQVVTLLNSDVELGNWNENTQTFDMLAGSDEADATACRVTVPLTAARGNSAGLFFAKIFGSQTQDVVASAVAGGLRWDLVIVQDVTGSYADELSYAVTGDQYALDSIYKYAPSAELGVVQFTGWGSTVAPLQTVRTNYTSLRNSIGAMRIGTGSFNGGTWTGGGNGTTVGVTPPASGTDIASGMQQALLLYNAGTYNPPPGTRKAMVISTDGLPNGASNGSHPSMTDAQLLTLAQQVADQAWAQGISVFALLYDRGGGNNADAVQSLVRGNGTFVKVTEAPYLPAAMRSIVTNDMLYVLLK